MDELQKIAEAHEQTSGEKFKKTLKNSLIVAGGAGAAALASTAFDHYVLEKLIPQSHNLPPVAKNIILGLLSVGGAVAAKKMYEEMNKP